MRKILIAVTCFCTVATFAQSPKQLQKIAATIKPSSLKDKLSVIAGAAMEGRETATPGQKMAAAYIENYFKELGLQPASAVGYQMYFTVYQDSVSSSSLKINNSDLAVNKDYALSRASITTGSWTEDSIVFASFGIVDSTTNDYKTLSVKDKWVVVADGKPEDADNAGPAAEYSFRNPATAFMKLYQAKLNGAKGLIIVSKDFPGDGAASYKGNMYLKKGNGKNIPALYVSYKVAEALTGKKLQSFADIKSIAPGAYATVFSFSSDVVTNTLQSSNVIGVMPGTDKKDEYVFVTGHYDHLGKKGDNIYYGADDDGSGTTGVLQIAAAFAKAKQKGYNPRRTMVFMTVSGEEKGLWGSEYYTANPLVPLDKTSVDLNIDMVGRIDPQRKDGDSTNYVYTIGEDKLSTDLLPISDSINNNFIHLELDRKFNDPNDPNRFYYRSDHYNFAKHGVPVIFYFNGTHADYHKPTDTVDKINFALMAKRVKLVFYTAWNMANRNDMLKRDIPLK